MKTKTKKAISLIVLVITIIVLAILAATVILTITNTGLINSAKDAINKAELKQVEKIANLAWSEAFVEGKRGQTELEDYVMDMLEKNNINIGKYVIIVTTEGVTVEPFRIIAAGLYETGTNYGTLITSWDELVASGAIVVTDGAVSVGKVPPDNLPEKNVHGFYYGVLYNDYGYGFVFYEDGSVEKYGNDELLESYPAGSAVYSVNTIDMSSIDYGVWAISAEGMSIVDDWEYEYSLGAIAQLAGDLMLPSDGSVTSIGYDAFCDCTSLTSIEIPEAVTSIGEYAFGRCASLTSITYAGTVEKFNSISLALGWNADIPKIEFACSNGTILMAGLFLDLNDGLLYLWESLLRDDVVRVEDGVLYTNFNEETGKNPASAMLLGDLVLPNDGSITSIGDNAFDGCTGLSSIEIPENVTSIGDRAFYMCTGLTSITYAGTREQFHNIARGLRWDKYVMASEVVCSDGNYPLVRVE